MRNAKQGQQQLSETVATNLREQIISGVLPKGSFLRIEAIAQSLGVSTTPVREGLLILQSESLVKLIPRRGFMVTSLGKNDLYDLFWTQATIGAELAKRATMMLSAAQLDQLDALNKEYLQAVQAKDSATLDKAGYQFHRIINLAANSPRMSMLMGSLTKQLSNRFYTDIEGQAEDVLAYHPLILQALRLRDSESVHSLMFRHILNGGKHLIAMLERQGLWDDSPTLMQSDTWFEAPAVTPRRESAKH